MDIFEKEEPDETVSVPFRGLSVLRAAGLVGNYYVEYRFRPLPGIERSPSRNHSSRSASL